MEAKLILHPVFVMVALTLVVWLLMGHQRRMAVRSRQVKLSYFRLYEGEIPDHLIQTSRHFINLFEMPVLFYLAVVLILFFERVDIVHISLAWGFVALRLLHSFIHLTYNKVMHRFFAYVASGLCLWGMWAYFAWQMI